MVHYIQPSLLVEACSPEAPTHNLGTMLVEVIATVLDNEVNKNINGFFSFFLFNAFLRVTMQSLDEFL